MMYFFKRMMVALVLLALALVKVLEATISQLGSVYLIVPQRFEVDPVAPYRNQLEFAKAHGPRGVYLLESLGAGHYPTHQQLTADYHRRSNPGPVYFYDYF
ncbi:hypothetical protein OTU49_008851, partial [Cherax quadricarinatus]